MYILWENEPHSRPLLEETSRDGFKRGRGTTRQQQRTYPVVREREEMDTWKDGYDLKEEGKKDIIYGREGG